MREIKRPKKLVIFDMAASMSNTPIVKLLCGGMHTLALAASGAVFSWGCNDEGALGRFGMEDKPMQVPLAGRVTDIAAGDSHSIFLNKHENNIFFCGLYRVRNKLMIFLECNDWSNWEAFKSTTSVW